MAAEKAIGKAGRAGKDKNTFPLGAISQHNVILAHLPSMGSNKCCDHGSGLAVEFSEDRG